MHLLYHITPWATPFLTKHKNPVASLLTNNKELAIIKKHRGFTATSSAMKNKDW